MPKKEIIAVDFDGTCVEHVYPKVGKELPYCSQVLKELSKTYNLILYTMRSDKELQDAVDWFKERDIPLYSVNSNPTQKFWTKSPKIYANIYIDDAAFGAPLFRTPEMERPGIRWKAVAEELCPDLELKTRPLKTLVINSYEEFYELTEGGNFELEETDLEKGLEYGTHYFVHSGVTYGISYGRTYCNDTLEFPETAYEVAEEDE